MLSVKDSNVDSQGDLTTLLTDYLYITDYIYKALSEDEKLGKSGARRLILKVVIDIFKKRR